MVITIKELYEKDSKKRKKIARKSRIYRFFGYNPRRIAFKRKCALCLHDLTDDTVEGVWEMDSFSQERVKMYKEEHQCGQCKQRWLYHRGPIRGNYRFDEANQKEYERFAWVREQNKKRLDLMPKQLEKK